MRYAAMRLDDISDASIVDLCATDGFQFKDIEKVKSDVYRGTLASGDLGGSSTVYVKLYPPERAENLREFARVATDADHPDCRVVEGDYIALVMGRANGRPLSHVLPIAFVPGVWTFYRDRIKQAYVQIGKSLAVLHNETSSWVGPVLCKRALTDRMNRINLQEHFGDHVVKRIENILERGNEIQSIHAVTYGDRSPHNIYFDGKEITHIDSFCSRRSVAGDHASVILGIRLMVGRLPYARSKIKQLLESAYWEGYSSAEGTQLNSDKAVAIRYVSTILRLLDYYTSNPSTVASRLIKRVDMPILRNEIESTVRDVPLSLNS